MVEQHRHIAVGDRQVADEQRHGAGALDQDLTERQHVIAGERAVDDVLHLAHGLIGQTLQPQDAREKALGHGVLVEDGDLDEERARGRHPLCLEALAPADRYRDNGHLEIDNKRLATHSAKRIDQLLPWADHRPSDKAAA